MIKFNESVHYTIACLIKKNMALFNLRTQKRLKYY